MIMITRLSIAEHNHVVDDDRDVGVGVQYDQDRQMTSCIVVLEYTSVRKQQLAISLDSFETDGSDYIWEYIFWYR